MTEILLALKSDTDTLVQAWTPYTPGAVTSGTGTITTAAATGRQSQPASTQADGSGVKAGKLCFFSLTVTITTNGTGATNVQVANGLPVAPVGSPAFAGVRTDTGKAVVAVASGRNLTITFYDNTYPGANGATFVFTGSYEAQ
jgi:hypothetical protein